MGAPEPGRWHLFKDDTLDDALRPGVLRRLTIERSSGGELFIIDERPNRQALVLFGDFAAVIVPRALVGRDAPDGD
jgi:hypothetical protein